jgi:hypothetical protein
VKLCILKVSDVFWLRFQIMRNGSLRGNLLMRCPENTRKSGSRRAYALQSGRIHPLEFHLC